MPVVSGPGILIAPHWVDDGHLMTGYVDDDSWGTAAIDLRAGRPVKIEPWPQASLITVFPAAPTPGAAP